MGPLLTVTDVLSTPGKFGSTKIQCPKGNAKAECPNVDSDSEEVWSTSVAYLVVWETNLDVVNRPTIAAGRC